MSASAPTRHHSFAARLWGKPPFSVPVLRQMNKTDDHGPCSGEDFSWILLAAKDDAA
jgi:hypothetical protein